jgi:ATP-dependent protease HslVU (ClpYQ) peptidase subunit
MLVGLQFSDITLYLVAVLGLLVLWQYYQMQIMAGRILAIDIFDRSGIRMYLYLTPDGDDACEVCSAANGRVFLPSQVAKKGFSALGGKCKRPKACLGVLVGLYGGWLEARGLLEQLRSNLKKSGRQMSAEEIQALVNGQWERCISAETDRLAVHMIEAICIEKLDQAVAIDKYRYVVEEAKEVRHLLLLVPAYLRLVSLLVKAGEAAEALELIERFERRFPVTKRGPHFPSDQQREIMATRKTHLIKNQPLKIPA